MNNLNDMAFDSSKVVINRQGDRKGSPMRTNLSRLQRGPHPRWTARVNPTIRRIGLTSPC